MVSEPAMSPSGRRQPVGWTLPALPPLPPPPNFYVLSSTVGREPGSETEHCAPRSWAVSLLAHQGSQKALILTRGLPVPGLLGLISLAWNLLEQGPHLNQLTKDLRVHVDKPECFCPSHWAKALCAFFPCLETTPADGRYCHHLCLTDEKT